MTVWGIPTAQNVWGWGHFNKHSAAYFIKKQAGLLNISVKSRGNKLS